ncbi:MAG: alpha-L-fucosidase [Planctomycetota bacterium]|nr:MAG: alpha-L-fucosidase [Planctomycetota bacterium]
MKKSALICLVLFGLLVVGCQEPLAERKVEKYEPTWESVRAYKEVPEWLREGKFGIYTHWGPYAVHAYGENTTWYSHGMYMDPESEAREHFEENFGKLTPEFGYKDLIPKFTAEKFNADEWADLFAKSGAKFAGPVAEHHDGFAMWDTKYSDWNAAKMGPKRDVVGELEKAIKKRDMKFVTAFHHAANWFFFPVWDKRYDTGDPKYSGLYGQPHAEGAMRNQEFLDEWYGKIIEVIDKYSPDFIWFDFALDSIPEGYVKDFLAYYYNHAEAEGKEVVVTYKGNDLVPGTGVRDLELGQEPRLTYHEWITDSTVDDRGAWGYANDLVFKSPNRVIDNLVDRVSKNGYLLLNVGPKPDGTIPEAARDLLLEVGEWLKINGEAVYGTSPWTIASEGPTNLGDASAIGFNESNVVYTSKDIRFTVKGDNLYATFLAWPGEEAVIRTLRGEGEEERGWKGDANVDKSMSLAGKTFTVRRFTFEFKEDADVHITARWEEDEVEEFEGKYEQEGTSVTILVEDEERRATYDGEDFELIRGEGVPRYEGFYEEEIKRITMLGDNKSLKWKRTSQGLVIETPDKRPCKHAYVIKIERYHHPKID